MDLQSLNFLRESNLRIGVLGGSFNPAHQGHLDISMDALKLYKFDYIMWLIASQNPLKENYQLTIYQRGYKALETANNHPCGHRILVTTAERDMGTFYLYDSMNFLIRRFPQVDFTWLMGMDNITNFHKWYRYEELAKLCKIIVFDRPVDARFRNHCRFLSKFKPTIAKLATANIIIRKGRLNSISSTKIRSI